MKKILCYLLALSLVFLMIGGLAACDTGTVPGPSTGGTTDGSGTDDTGNGDTEGGNGGSDGTGDIEDNGDSDDSGDSDGSDENDETQDGAPKLLLIEDGVALFQVVYTSNAGSDGVRAAREFVTTLRNLGVEINDPVSDGSLANVEDCEIIIGTEARYRGEICSLSEKALGTDGSVIKVVEKRIIIAGGTASGTVELFRTYVSEQLGITDELESLETLSANSDYYYETLTEYPITHIRVAGSNLSSYTLLYDIESMGFFNTGELEAFRTRLYNVSGCWLELGEYSERESYKRCFIIRHVEDAGEDGFRVYMEDGDFIIECAYANAFEKAMGEFAENYIYSKTGVVTFPSNFEYSTNVSKVYYSDFGAVGDGLADDFRAIYDAHQYANQSGQTVYGQKGAIYHIYPESFLMTIPVKTDVDFCGATFVIDDTGSVAYAKRQLALFTLQRDAEKWTLSTALIQSQFGEVSLSAGDRSIEWLHNFLEGTSLVFVTNGSHRDYIRYGSNQNSGRARNEVLVVYEDGTISEDTAVSFDYDTITQIVVYNADDKPIKVGNGTFHNICCRCVPETNYTVEYDSYNRGFKIERCNSTLYNLTHRMLDEPDLGWVQNEELLQNTADPGGKKGSGQESYPYNRGFFYICETYNLLIENSSISGHTTYYEPKAGTATSNSGGMNYVAAGSYDFVVENSTHIKFDNVTQYNNAEAGLGDSRYWGIMSSNFSKNMTFVDCEINRFDAHQGFWNASIINTTIGHTLNVIGGGNLYLENVTRLTGASFMTLRSDYGATFKGDVTIKDCTLNAYNSYNTALGGSFTGSRAKTGYVINSGYSNSATSGPAYWAWDFGYTCYMPQNITFIGEFNYHSTNLYIYNANYNNYYEYMIAQDENYIPYQVTKTITYKDWNQNQIAICSGTGKIFANTEIITLTTPAE